MAGYIGTQPVPQATQTRDAFTATAGQTSFTTSGYTPGFLDVYLNGVKLAAADYTASNGSDVVLTAGAAAGDIFEVVAYTTFELLDPTFGGTVTADSLSVDGGTIKLDGNYPVGSNNVALGDTALDSLTSGTNNTALGSAALRNNTTASQNTAVGYQSLYSNVTGTGVTAIGYQSGRSSTASDNTFVGNATGYSTTTGSNNLASGSAALYANTTGSYNTAVGRTALFSNTTASYNTAVGYQAAYSNTTGVQHVAMGRQALYSNTTGMQNTAIGQRALYDNTTGQSNTALGYSALENNTTADKNTAVGYQAGYNTTTPDNNSFFGQWSGYNNTTGAGNTYIGQGAGYSMTTGSENTIIGAYNGNQGGLDIRTSSNNIVLSDGDGNVRAHCDSSGTWTGVGGSTTAGAVGTYAFLWRDDAGTTLGTTHAGSTLFYAIINDDNTSGAVANVYHGNGTVRSGISPSGTWRAMGSAGSYSAAYGQATVYVRIS